MNQESHAEAVTAALDAVENVLVPTTPSGIIEQAHSMAGPLAEHINSRKLYTVIKGRKFVHVEGWTTLAAMLGVTCQMRNVTENPNVDGEFIALVTATTSDGRVIGRASASCGPDESEWAKRSRQARRSMAQTRATGKVCRMLFSWVMQLAGYEVTPFEEMDAKPKARTKLADEALHAES